MAALTAHADPAALVPGDADGVEHLSRQLLRYAQGAAEAGRLLRSVEAGAWTGPAAEAFLERVGSMPQRLDLGADAFSDASRALSDYAAELREARRAAARAVELVQEADAATAAWHAATVAHAAAVDRAEKALATGSPVAAVGPGPSGADPGEPLRAQARRVLEDARERLQDQGDRSAARLRAAREQAPDEPGFFSRAAHHAGEFLKGAGEATLELGEFAYKMNPTYLLVDPAGFVEHKQELLEGIVYGVQNPVEFAKAAVDWQTWKENPARALGHLVPDLVLAVATAGAGTAGSAANRVSTGVRRLPGGGVRPTLGDGTRRPLADQMREPHVHPSNAHLVDFDRDPLAGRTPDEFLDRWQVAEEPGGPRDWDWPPNKGGVPGTGEWVRPETLSPDRIGKPEGTFFGESGDPFHTRSLPPDRLNFSREDWEVDVARVKAEGVVILRSEVAPWFDQPGGGSQYQFFGPDAKTPLTQAQLAEKGIIRPVTR